MWIDRWVVLTVCNIALVLDVVLSGTHESQWTNVLVAAVLGAVFAATAAVLVRRKVAIECVPAHVDARKSPQQLRIDKQLRDTRERLARATQIAEVGELSASIAHEINQPLAAVVAHGHACHTWLTENPPNVPRALQSAKRIIRDAKGAADVIQRIRALYRHDPPHKDLLSVNELIEETGRLIEAEARGRSIVLRTRLARSLPRIQADRVQIQQVLFNLTRNAMEAMESVANRSRKLRIVSLEREGKVVVQVHDTGVGMEDFSSAFQPFYTTKPNGMGMGLAICRSIVESHNGRLWAEPAVPHGSIFTLSLPAAEVAEQSVEARIEWMGAERGRSKSAAILAQHESVGIAVNVACSGVGISGRNAVSDSLPSHEVDRLVCDFPVDKQNVWQPVTGHQQ